MDKNTIIKDLINLAIFQGEHNGRWEDEYAIEESCERYLNDMKSLADKYSFEYDDDLEQFRECGDDYEYELKDRMGFFLYESIKEILVGKLT